MSEAPIDSIRAIVDYDWSTEQRDYEECEINGNEQAGHVFEHLQAVRTWLDEQRVVELEQEIESARRLGRDPQRQLCELADLTEDLSGED